MSIGLSRYKLASGQVCRITLSDICPTTSDKSPMSDTCWIPDVRHLMLSLGAFGGLTAPRLRAWPEFSSRRLPRHGLRTPGRCAQPSCPARRADWRGTPRGTRVPNHGAFVCACDRRRLSSNLWITTRLRTTSSLPALAAQTVRSTARSLPARQSRRTRGASPR